MTYLDHGATSFPKPPQVHRAVAQAMRQCANPGRGGYPAAMAAAEALFRCREGAQRLFRCPAEQVVLTENCTQGLNVAIRTLVHPGDPVVISGFEHNAVTRPLYALGAKCHVAGRRLFDHGDTLQAFETALKAGVRAAVFTHVSNVFGYVLPVLELAALCRQYGVPFIMDAAQSAGSVPIDFEALGADFIAMPGHKGLLGPQGTGLLLCGRLPRPLCYGGTGTDSLNREMPDYLPERAEPGTRNVPGAAGLAAGLEYLYRVGVQTVGKRERTQAKLCGEGLKKLGFRVFSGEHQSGVVSFQPDMDCQEAAERLAGRGIAVRAGLHCAPLAHETAGTLETGTVRVSFGYNASDSQTQTLLRAASQLR